MRRVSAVVSMFVVVGCGRVGFSDAFSDQTGLDGAQLGECQPGTPSEDFSSQPSLPCEPWGETATRGLDVVRRNGRLEITPQPSPPNPSDFGGCTIRTHDLHDGAVVEVSSVVGGNNGYTNMVFYWTVDSFLDTSLGLQVGGWNGMLYAMTPGGDTGHRPYDPLETRFWRIAVDDTHRVRAQVSPDARSWADLASVDVTGVDLTSGRLAFGAGREPGAGATGITRFESLNRCPSSGG